MPKAAPEMTGSDVVEFVQLLAQHQIALYIDGGWGVDAYRRANRAIQT
jgi:hypothetical protein